MIISRQIIHDYQLLLIYLEEVLIFKELIWLLIMVYYFIINLNVDFPGDRDSYLHRVGRAGRFGTKGLAINFVKPDDDITDLDKQ